MYSLLLLSLFWKMILTTINKIMIMGHLGVSEGDVSLGKEGSALD